MIMLITIIPMTTVIILIKITSKIAIAITLIVNIVVMINE